LMPLTTTVWPASETTALAAETHAKSTPAARTNFTAIPRIRDPIQWSRRRAASAEENEDKERRKNRKGTPHLLSLQNSGSGTGSYPCILIIRYRVPGSAACTSIVIASNGGWEPFPTANNAVREWWSTKYLTLLLLILYCGARHGCKDPGIQR
jgi:hypothetical protein